MNNEKIRVALIDDHKLIRQALIKYIKDYESTFTISVVFDGDDGSDLLNNIDQHPVDVAIVDLYMARLDGLQAVKRLKQQRPDQKILMLSMCTELSTIAQLLDLGIQSYISKGDDLHLVPQAIISLYQEKPFQTKIMTDALYFARTHKTNKHHHTRKLFSDRELRIIEMLWEERNNKEIADALFLGVRSIEKTVHEMKVKANTESLTGLLKYCIGHKIIG